MPGQRQQVVPHGPRQQEQRLQIPMIVQRDAEHGVDGDKQGAEGNGRIALTEAAKQNKADGRHGQTKGKQRRPRKQQLHGGGGDKKANQSNGKITQTAGQTVVKVGQSRSHDAEGEGDGQFDFADPPGKQRCAAERDKNSYVIKPGAVPGVAA